MGNAAGGGEAWATVTDRELHDRTAEVLRRVERGEHLRVTMEGRPVAELRPLDRRSTWVPRHRAVSQLVQADVGLCRDIDEALPDRVDEV